MLADRPGFRKVHFFDGLTGRSREGFYQAGALAERNMLWIIENVLLVAGTPWTVWCKRSNCSITATDIILAPGDYDVHSSGMFYAILTIHLMLIPHSDISHVDSSGSHNTSPGDQ